MRTLALVILCLCIPLSGIHADAIPKYKRSYFGGWAIAMMMPKYKTRTAPRSFNFNNVLHGQRQ